VADEPTLLFPPDPAPTPPLRPAGFPVGEGGDLSAAFTARVRDAERHHQRAAMEAKEEFQHRGDQLERQLRGDYQRRIQTVEQQAEARYQQAVKRVEAEAAQRVDRAAQATMQSQSLQQRAEMERDKVANKRTLLVRAAAAGWIVAVILLLILVAQH
jgi:CHASE3 domain sensor protein